MLTAQNGRFSQTQLLLPFSVIFQNFFLAKTHAENNLHENIYSIKLLQSLSPGGTFKASFLSKLTTYNEEHEMKIG
jgi:hypothetical protein